MADIVQELYEPAALRVFFITNINKKQQNKHTEPRLAVAVGLVRAWIGVSSSETGQANVVATSIRRPIAWAIIQSIL